MGKVRSEFSFKPQIQGDTDLQHDQAYPINYTFKILGFKEKKFSHRVFPSYNSYAEVRLEPVHPISFNSIEADEYSEIATPIATILIQKEDGQHSESIYRLFSLVNNQLMVNQRPLSHLNDHEQALIQQNRGQCYVGFTGRKTPVKIRFYNKNKTNKNRALDDSLTEEEKRGTWDIHKASLPRERDAGWRALAKNQVGLYRNFKDFHDSYDSSREHAEPLEILGRASIGIKDKFYDIGRDCTLKERHLIERKQIEDLGCNNSQNMFNVDRYLVTSPKIRAMDNVKNFRDIGKKISSEGTPVGIRWINVVDVDLIDRENRETYFVCKKKNSKGGNNSCNSMTRKPRSSCLGNDSIYKYMRTQQYQRHYYPQI